HRFTRLVRVARRHHDAGARGGETARHAQPDPAVAPGHDRHPSFEVEHPGPPLRCKVYTGDSGVVVLAIRPPPLRLSLTRLRSISSWHCRCTTRPRSHATDRTEGTSMIADVRLLRHGASVGARLAPPACAVALAG